MSPPWNDERSTRLSVRDTARRTAILVNALTAEPSPDPGAIAGILLDHGEPGPVELTAGDVAGMRTAALRLREVFAAARVDEAAGVLNRLLREGTGPLRLSSHDGRSPWHPHLDSDDEAPWGEWFLASSCMALTVLIWDGQRPPGGLCSSPSCGDVFLTVGSGPERRYCSRRCATRERVAAHRRAKAGPRSP
ncbi:CGNR zinc finger domain-containing protein [Streptomyces sp. 4503]|uniref:CGNR zinc finger domain-containing protein n=1 Tax=Streptomyces niphimycinicus TaxID=2842201 RepID=A0ABS6CTB4_9ACTN|nr:CGNR zinc finger domain-containing protein [Streptomyces niphimycinicus]MBU3870202.1 CGNR zinc finger domain-containing protein [Streptomyces niphimycinicus]